MTMSYVIHIITLDPKRYSQPMKSPRSISASMSTIRLGIHRPADSDRYLGRKETQLSECPESHEDSGFNGVLDDI